MVCYTDLLSCAMLTTVIIIAIGGISHPDATYREHLIDEYQHTADRIRYTMLLL